MTFQAILVRQICVCGSLIAKDHRREHLRIYVKALRREYKGPREIGLFIDSKSYPDKVTCLKNNQSLPYRISYLSFNQTPTFLGFLSLN